MSVNVIRLHRTRCCSAPILKETDEWTSLYECMECHKVYWATHNLDGSYVHFDQPDQWTHLIEIMAP